MRTLRPGEPRKCGSTLQFLSDKFPRHIDLALGVLDDDPGVRPVMHIFTGSKAPWYEIEDGLPQHGAWHWSEAPAAGFGG